MSHTPIYQNSPVDFRLDLKDPFIFTAHHIDHYPAGNAQLGPKSPAQDHEYRMYYGDIVPGFPAHPHTGFETITLLEQGYVDHFDSLGNAGRYGAGDVQWLSTGSGVQHCEMFPLLHQDQANPFELFQIWFNSSPEQKQQPADYKMLWREQIPHVQQQGVDIRVIAGQLNNTSALIPPVHSWAYDATHHVNIFLIQMTAGHQITLPATTASSNRFCYFYQGQGLILAEQHIQTKHLLELQPDTEITLQATNEDIRILWLEGEPIGAPIAMRGPFVLNSDAELTQAFARYRATQFGGWPWPDAGPVFELNQTRFASYEGGIRTEYPEQDH